MGVRRKGVGRLEITDHGDTAAPPTPYFIIVPEDAGPRLFIRPVTWSIYQLESPARVACEIRSKESEQEPASPECPGLVLIDGLAPALLAAGQFENL